MFAGVEHIGGRQAERIDGAVRYLYGAKQRRVDRGFQTQCFSGGKRFSINTGLLTGVDKGLLPGHVIFRQGDKQPVGGFNAVAGDAT